MSDMIGIINDSLAEKMISAITENSTFDRGRISYEIQDDFNFILITVVTDEVVNVSPMDRRRVAKIVNDRAPQRKGEYTWMINYSLSGVIFDSYFGGDSLAPNSGL